MENSTENSPFSKYTKIEMRKSSNKLSFIILFGLIVLISLIIFLSTISSSPISSQSFNEEQAKTQLTKYFQSYFNKQHLFEEIEDISFEEKTSNWIGSKQESKASVGLKSGNGIETYFTWDAIKALSNGEKLPSWSFGTGTNKKYPSADIANMNNCVSSDNECIPGVWNGNELHCENSLRPELLEKGVNWNMSWLPSIVCSCKNSGQTIVLKQAPVNSCDECSSKADNIHAQCVNNTICEKRTSYKLHQCSLDFDVKLEKSSEGMLNLRITLPKELPDVLIKKAKDKECPINLITNLKLGENLFNTKCKYMVLDNCINIYKAQVLIKEIDCLGHE